MKKIVVTCLLFTAIFSHGEEFFLEGVRFHYRIPQQLRNDSRIMVLFGGRNWPGDKTIKIFQFDALADRHGLILLSPSFRDREYWQPENGFGERLLRAVAVLEKKYRLKSRKLFFYGYSAGGQCANLFYAFMPQRVEAWGAHGCGVYFKSRIQTPVPALITCGKEDQERLRISRDFLYRYREAGGQLVWKYYPNAHELNHEALNLARAWFDSRCQAHSPVAVGEDDTGQLFSLKEMNKIEPEFRNMLSSDAEIEEFRR